MLEKRCYIKQQCNASGIFGCPVDHFSLFETGTKLGHADLLHLHLHHRARCYQVRGLCNVLISPSFRYQGHATQLIKAITTSILQSAADLGMLFCNPSLKNLYAACDWIAHEAAITRIGTPNQFYPYKALRMMYAASPHGLSLIHI